VNRTPASESQEATDDQAAAPAAESPPVESSGERLVRHGRRLRLYIWAGVLVGALVILIALVAANTRSVKLDWVFGSTHASLVWVIVAAGILGWVLGLATSTVFRHRTRRRS
jgi:uncharacterized integral membrane protein